MYQETVRVRPKDLIGKPLHCDLVSRDKVIHKSGEVFTEETLERCRQCHLVEKEYWEPRKEYLWIPAEVSGKKCFEFIVQPYSVWQVFEVWADDEAEARELLEDDPGDPVDEGCNRDWQIVETKEITQQKLAEITQARQLQMKNLEEEIKRKKQELKKLRT